ncbi:MAG TPA: flagellar basal-body rod protein FlgF [Terriglobales bacterium]|nr:flagellar basal-body rod protein FlgF [Terriglobales bacterium]
MDSGYYAACTALKAQSNALELVANNVANVNTTGYRGQIPSFESLLLESQPSFPTNSWSRLINQFSVLNGARLDLTEGNLERTGNPLDFALEGPGFFAVQTKAGTLYTRNGKFQIAASGQLVTSAGDAVLGTGGPIMLPLNAQPSISADGTISVAGAVAGKLKLVEFAPGAQVKAVGGSYYSAPAKSAVIAAHAMVRQGMLESSNVNPVTAVIGLITAQRQAEMAGRAMNAFYSDFDRIAADELPRT